MWGCYESHSKACTYYHDKTCYQDCDAVENGQSCFSYVLDGTPYTITKEKDADYTYGSNVCAKRCSASVTSNCIGYNENTERYVYCKSYDKDEGKCSDTCTNLPHQDCVPACENWDKKNKHACVDKQGNIHDQPTICYEEKQGDETYQYCLADGTKTDSLSGAYFKTKSDEGLTYCSGSYQKSTKSCVTSQYANRAITGNPET